MIAPEERISYGVLTEHNNISCMTWSQSYDEALEEAKSQHHRPAYIVECTEHFEIVGEVSKND